MRQFVRHRTFRLNEFSGRYAKFDEDAFYLPGLWRKQDQKDRQSSILGVSPTSWHYNNNADALEAVNKAIDSYNKLLERGVAKELARIVLPVCMMTKIVVNCDIHNLMHFFRLRLSSHAQQEIRELASAMFQYFAALFPWCAEAYKRYTVNIIDNQEKP
jgi:thymidylate synthase (FAD)